MRRATVMAAVLALAVPVMQVRAQAMTDAPARAASPMVVDVAAPSVDAVAPATPASVALAGAVALREVRRDLSRGPALAAGGGGIGRPEALMLIGVAAIVGGELVGGTGGHIVSLGGLAVGLYGLYLFLEKK
jgi:hypothetical protein